VPGGLVIVDKVFHGGLSSLSDEEKASVPSEMDFSDDEYRERLSDVFREHKGFKTESFDFFYQAQILWDETMAESVSQFLKIHPDYQMVVLAGNGHLEYASGIPSRTARRNNYDYAIILNDDGPEKGIADFVLFPGAVAGGATPSLMVFVKEEDGRVMVTGFSPKSVSQEAGMNIGDVVLAIDGSPVQTVGDLKIHLLSKKKGDAVKLRILRRSFFGFTREKDLTVVLR